MKKLLLIIFFLPALQLYAQSKFVIQGSINAFANGKAVISRSGPDEFYPLKKNKDTAAIHNHLFVFTGAIKYPEHYRIQIFSKGKPVSLTEPFFVSPGSHQMIINDALGAHDITEVGVRVSLSNDVANNEYINKFLPSYNKECERYENFYQAKSKCNPIKDLKKNRVV